MLTHSGDGPISVEPAKLIELAGRFSGVAEGTTSVQGTMSGFRAAADGCAAAAEDAFTWMQLMFDAALGSLGGSSGALSRATSSAAAAYPATDGAVFAPPGPPAP